jgi:hypothetical protein
MQHGGASIQSPHSILPPGPQADDTPSGPVDSSAGNRFVAFLSFLCRRDGLGDVGSGLLFAIRTG